MQTSPTNLVLTVKLNQKFESNSLVCLKLQAFIFLKKGEPLSI